MPKINPALFVDYSEFLDKSQFLWTQQSKKVLEMSELSDGLKLQTECAICKAQLLTQYELVHYVEAHKIVNISHVAEIKRALLRAPRAVVNDPTAASRARSADPATRGTDPATDSGMQPQTAVEGPAQVALPPPGFLAPQQNQLHTAVHHENHDDVEIEPAIGADIRSDFEPNDDVDPMDNPEKR